MNIRAINKYSIRWQLIRVDARKIKDVDEKISFVIRFLQRYNSIENYARVKNWMQMTKLGYRQQSIKSLFTESIKEIEDFVYDMEDEVNDFTDWSEAELIKLYKDLSKRKYGFLINKIPISHIKFMNELCDELGYDRLEMSREKIN